MVEIWPWSTHVSPPHPYVSRIALKLQRMNTAWRGGKQGSWCSCLIIYPPWILLLQASPCLLANQFMQILPEPCVIIVLTPDISRPAGSHCHVLTKLSFPQNILLFPAPNWGSWECTVRPPKPPWLRCLIGPLLICMFVSLSTDESQTSLSWTFQHSPIPLQEHSSEELGSTRVPPRIPQRLLMLNFLPNAFWTREF